MMRVILLLSLMLLTTKIALAMSSSQSPLLLIEKDQPSYDLAPYMEMYIDKENQLKIEQVSDPLFSKNFIPYNFTEQRSVKNYGQSVWLRFTIKNLTAHDIHLFLTTNYPNQYTSWSIYQQTQDGMVKLNFTPKDLHVSLFPLDIPSHSSQTYYMNNYSEGWLQTTFSLKKPFVHLLNQADWFFVVGFEYGIAIALLFHSLFIYLFLRDKSYLIYIIFVCSTLLAFVLMDGLLNRLPFVTVTNWWYLHTYRFSLVLSGFLYVLFTKSILQIKQYAPRMNTILNAQLMLGIPCAITAWIPSFGYPLLAQAEILTVSIYLVISGPLSLLASIVVLRKGYKPAQYYVAGMVCLAIGITFYFLTNQQIIEISPFIYRLPQLSVDLDMILQAIALAVRFNLIQEMQIKTQREIIIQKDLNVKLQNRSLKEKQHLINAYARFFPRRFLELLEKKSILDIQLGDQTEKYMTVLFADLRNFTSLLEKKTSSESFAFINGYLSQIGPLIRKHKGLVDKYIGDAILALYEGPADGAIYSAIEIIRVLRQVSDDSPETIDMGIGIHYGNLMVGTIGEEKRMDGTVISDTVNTASRLENLNKIYGTHIIVSEEILSSLTNKDKFYIRFIDHIYAKGKKISVKLYEVFNTDPTEIIRRKLEIQEKYDAAMQHYQNQEFEKALEIFNQCHETLPADEVILLYIDRCKTLIHEHIRSWKPIVKISDKTELIYDTST